MMVLESVSRTFAGCPPVEALRDVNLLIEQGEWVSIVGPSGAGKSTLLNVLGLLDSPTDGTYFFDGLDVGGMDRSQQADLRARALGFVFQSFHLIPTRSLLENVQLGLVYAGVERKERDRRALAAIEAVGLKHRLAADVATLSGGERQRAAVARAVASDCSVLLCDEPTGNLDNDSAERVFSHISRLHQRGATVIVVTHSEEVSALGSRILHVRNGLVSDSSGTP